MIQFQCDYEEGCAPQILERLVQTNMEQTVGYGLDDYCRRAKSLILDLCGLSDSADPTRARGEQTDGIVHFLVGGTQTNATVIKAMLRPHQGVVCADSSHINVHETGAIELSGHKVIALPSQNGLLSAEQVEVVFRDHAEDPNIEHMVQPGMVYVSYPSEVGTLYTKAQLCALHDVCRRYSVPLYVDGARMGYGLMSPASDMTLRDFSQLADAFYIGGTKQGALFGEALVIANPLYRRDFRYYIKQGGGMLAKGRLLGLQFEALFRDGLYFHLSRHAVDMAMKIRSALISKGYALYMDSCTNQQFAVFDDSKLSELERYFLFSFWIKPDATHTAVRICTSWATTEESVDLLISKL